MRFVLFFIALFVTMGCLIGADAVNTGATADTLKTNACAPTSETTATATNPSYLPPPNT